MTPGARWAARMPGNQRPRSTAAPTNGAQTILPSGTAAVIRPMAAGDSPRLLEVGTEKPDEHRERPEVGGVEEPDRL